MSHFDHELLLIAAARSASNLLVPPDTRTAAETAFIARTLRLRKDSRLLWLLDGSALPGASGLGGAEGHVVAFGVDHFRHIALASLDRCNAVAGSQRFIPFREGCFSAIAEFYPSAALTAESDEESVALLRSLASLLVPGGRYLCGGVVQQYPSGLHVSADKRRIDEWRWEANGVRHHTVRLVRPDGSWRRLHERVRVRNSRDVEQLLAKSGFSLLNAFRGFGQHEQEPNPTGMSILLCRRD